jgi:hypothetical protein
MSANGRKLFLGGLTKTTTTEQLFEIFGKFGTVVDAVVMERNGNPRGFGFVTFKEKSSLSDVLAEGVVIDGREVDIKRAVPEDEMAIAPSKVFVGGLSQKVDKSHLLAHFSQYGEVRDAVVMVDRATGRSRGFGFVRFSSPEAVNRVLESPQELDGQHVDVKRAEPADAGMPSYPRTRTEEKAAAADAKSRRRRRGKKADFRDDEPDLPAAAFPGLDPKEVPSADAALFASAAQANLAMWSLLSMGQMGVPGMGAGQVPPAFPGGFGNPGLGMDFSAAILAGMGGVQMPPDLGSLELNTDLKEDLPAQGSPFGDLSNVLLPNGSRPTSPDKVHRAATPPLGKNAALDFGATFGPQAGFPFAGFAPVP